MENFQPFAFYLEGSLLNEPIHLRDKNILLAATLYQRTMKSNSYFGTQLLYLLS